VSATSGIMSAVSLRKAISSALPFHIVAGKSVSEATDLILKLHDHEQQQKLHIKQLHKILLLLAPLRKVETVSLTPECMLHGHQAMSMEACKCEVVRSTVQA
jgi:hypothetical protein